MIDAAPAVSASPCVQFAPPPTNGPTAPELAASLSIPSKTGAYLWIDCMHCCLRIV